MAGRSPCLRSLFVKAYGDVRAMGRFAVGPCCWMLDVALTRSVEVDTWGKPFSFFPPRTPPSNHQGAFCGSAARIYDTNEAIRLNNTSPASQNLLATVNVTQRGKDGRVPFVQACKCVQPGLWTVPVTAARCFMHPPICRQYLCLRGSMDG